MVFHRQHCSLINSVRGVKNQVNSGLKSSFPEVIGFSRNVILPKKNSKKVAAPGKVILRKLILRKLAF